ncbi:Abhydrolase domain-containing protein mpaH [Pseudocercospora fuligena]|uniref:Abhydrolase domain-containing protein mpaH n=1 Tax=Pseudocercospora fuligena TaxID=685502 RepID=A0A8H6RM30_9PEZI|nr:Abhydrolase domain-containing protein mpaH [Pseudocercospora fuligena]
MASSSPFEIREHTFQGQHIREYPGALANQEDAVWLHAKSYTPREVASGEVKGQLTIVGLHANGFHKEIYEPFLEYLYNFLKTKHGLVVGSIWFADQFNQGQSAVINDGVLGNDAHWWDHSRDILQMINTFRSQMRRPIVAVGHSMGGTQAVAASFYHPRIFEALVLMDPPMTMKYAPTLPQMLQFNMKKPEKFRSHEEASEFVQKSPFFKGWNKAVVQRYIKTAFHDGPTVLNPEPETVKLKTHPHAEARTLRYTHPDVHKDSPLTGPLYMPHTRQAYSFLGSLRPPVQFVLGKGSQICPKDEIEHRTKFRGTLPGGSGGIEAGNVESVIVKGGHFLPMTNPEGAAETVAKFLARRIEAWRKAEAAFMEKWSSQSIAEKQRLQPEEEKAYTAPFKPWNNPFALPDGGRSKL